MSEFKKKQKLSPLPSLSVHLPRAPPTSPSSSAPSPPSSSDPSPTSSSAPSPTSSSAPPSPSSSAPPSSSASPKDTEFFTEKINAQFVEDIEEIKPDSFVGLKLYTLSGLLERLDSFRVKTREIGSNEYYLRMKELNKEILIRFLASSICTGIGESYGQISVENAIQNKNYDIVVIANPSMEVDVVEQDEDSEDEDFDDSQVSDDEIQDMKVFNKEVADSPARTLEDFDRGKDAPYLNLGRPLRSETAPWEPTIPTGTNADQILNNKFKSILGFMVVQKDECPIIPGAYSVNLICAKERAPKGIGALLMGLYLETILKRPDIEQTALLELAGGNFRIPALCLYLKFGFRHEPRMLRTDCFTSVGNMPMILDLKDPEITSELILNIASGVNKKGFKLPLCQMTQKNQNIMSSLLEYSRLFNYAMEKQIDMKMFYNRCMSNPNLKTVYDYIITNYTGKPVDNINDYINGLILKLEKLQEKNADQTVKTDPLIQALGGVDGGKPKRTRTKRISRKKSRTRKHKK